MKVEDVSPELIEKAKACKTAEELLALAKNEGIELTEEQIGVISGGGVEYDDGGWAHDDPDKDVRGRVM